MFTSLPEGFQRALEKLRSSGQAVPLAQVARELLAIKGPIAADLARRVVGAALDHPSETLPAALDARHLRSGPEASVAGVPLAAAEFVVVDLETTGVSAERDAIVEIGAVRVARRLLPRLGRYDLDHLCAHFGIANVARHRALGDAEATARALIELLHEALGGRQIANVGDLLDLQMRAPARRRR